MYLQPMQGAKLSVALHANCVHSLFCLPSPFHALVIYSQINASGPILYSPLSVDPRAEDSFEQFENILRQL